MELQKATDAVKSLELPEWVKDLKVEEDVDQDGDPIVRVWMIVDEEFDLDKHPDVYEVEEKIEEAVRAAGVKEWTRVTLDSPIPE